MKWIRENLRFAIRGLIEHFRSGTSAKIQLVSALIVIGAGFYFEINRNEWIAIGLAIGLVLGMEALNTALESLADAVHPDRHPLVGRAKDTAAGAVLIAAIAAMAIGSIVFGPKSVRRMAATLSESETGLDLAGELTALLGPDRVSQAAGVLTEHSIDKWHASAPPDVVVLARNREDVSKTLRYANDHGIPVTTRGAGVGYVGGAVPIAGGIVLSVRPMDRIVEIDTADGVAVVEPGVILEDLQQAVQELGWYYPPDPASLKECSVGGNIATNAGGPRCLKYGVTRHYVLGLEVVLANGEVLVTGSRCHKNKTGFDLIGSFVGSEGLLGVVTQAILRLIPHPEARAMLTATFNDFSEAAEAVQKILGSRWQPSALEITDGFTLQAARDYLGAEVLPDGNAHLIVEIDGRAESVKGELADMKKFLESLGALTIAEAADDESCEAIWQLRRDFSYSLRETGLIKLNEDIVVPRSKLVQLVEFAHELQEETGIPVACFGHAGDGNIHTNLMVKDYDTDPKAREHADAALDRLFRWVLEIGGVITGEHGIGLAKKRWYPDAVSEVGQQVHRDLKAALDPKGILNPGKFV